jgi:predicted PurR-regulated permease PerM
LVFIFALSIIGLVIFYLTNIIIDALNTLSLDTSRIIPNGLDTIKDWLTSLPFLSTPEMHANIDNYFQQASSQLPDLFIGFLSNGWKLLSTSLSALAGFIILPIFTFFLLYDWENIRDKFFNGQSPWLRKHMKAVFDILQNVIVRYVRGQLLLGLVVGLCTWIMLMIFGIKFALPLAIFSAVTELVPMIGPWIGGGLGVLVTLALDPHKALWVGIGYVVIQLLENQLLVPKIQGSQMQLHPALVIFLSILGAYFAGILGFIIILPVTMLIIKLYRYFKESFHVTQMPEEAPDEEYFPP